MRRIVWVAVVLLGVLCVVLNPVRAQGNLTNHYANSELGFAFEYPENWKVTQNGSAIIAGTASDIQAVADNKLPDGLVLRIVGGDSASFKLSASDGLPELLISLGPVGTAAAIKLGGKDALRADLDRDVGSRVAVQPVDDNWLVITGSCSVECWYFDRPLFDDILSSFSFELNVASRSGKPQILVVNEKVEGDFTQGSGPFVFTFTAEAGDEITLTMVADDSGVLDPALVLLDPNGKMVARNDDSLDPQFGLTNARLVKFPITITGTYTIQATRSSDDNGHFTLLFKSSAGGISTAANISENGTALFGKALQGEISDDTWQVEFPFEANKGDMISVDVQSLPGSKLVPFVMILGVNGDKLISGEVNPRTPRTARIDGYIIKANGTFAVAVSRVNLGRGTSRGTFQVTITRKRASS